MNGRRWSVLSSKGQLSTARLLPRASICVWSAVWVGSSAESAMANLEPNRSGSANNVSMTSSWHTYSSSHNFVRPPSPAPILTGQAKLCEEGNALTSALQCGFSPSYPTNRGYNHLLITQSRGRQHASQQREGLPLSFRRNRNLPASIRPEDLRGASRNRRR